MVDEAPADRVEVRLVPYRAEWPELYEREAVRIREALGERVLLLEHVGSTAIPGLTAKPIIDICLAVRDPAAEAEYVGALERSGYALRIREPEWFQHRLLTGPDTPTNVHVFGLGVDEITNMLSFRDRLRSHAGDRFLYAQTKAALAARPWPSVQDYADAKSDVVQLILSRSASGVEGTP